MKMMDSIPGTGFAIIIALVLVAVIVYTFIKLRKQVKKAEDLEKRKSAKKFSKDHKSGKDRI